MKNKPNKVFLQINLDGEDVEDFKDLSEVSWHSEKIYEDDLVYISRDFVNSLAIALSALVDLKTHKHLFGKDERYLEEQPKAWESAKSVLENYIENYGN